VGSEVRRANPDGEGPVKVVLFCGGQGLRMREASDVVPKPMIPVGNMPILWHVMKYYAHFGFTDFILCLGYKAEVITRFFLETDVENWNITFVDTGLHSSIGERLRAVRHLLRDDEMFLANYGDTLTDAHLPSMIEIAEEAGVSVSFLAVKPNYSFHVVSIADNGRVDDIGDVTKSDMWINGGYFVMRTSFLDELGPGEDLVEEPLHRAIAASQVLAHRHHGFWAPMDTLKDKERLETLHESCRAPWQVWEIGPEAPPDVAGLASA
jgi:glucose-1-phosphate cytidylyltransferase